jgi:hypothetical protein
MEINIPNIKKKAVFINSTSAVGFYPENDFEKLKYILII